MQRARCRKVRYGVKSGNLVTLAVTAKHIRQDQAEQAVKWTEEAGIAAKGYSMLGLPGDREMERISIPHTPAERSAVSAHACTVGSPSPPLYSYLSASMGLSSAARVAG